MADIQCLDLCKTYRQGDAEIHALDHVTLDIEPGSFICLSGPSGSGKTTLLNAIGGLDELDSGEISIDGNRVDQLAQGPLADLRLHHIGFVFQAYNLIPVLTARENVEFVMQVQGLGAGERREKSMAILQEVGLEGMEDRRPAQLSGGQQQRVAVARALVSRPEIVFGDEPTGNLDSRSGGEVLTFLRDAVDRLGQTVVMVTHDPVAASYADRIVFLADGRIVDEMYQPTSDLVLDRMKRFGH